MKICIITNRFPANPDDVASPFVKDFYEELKKRNQEIFIFTPAYEVDRVDPDKNIYRFDWAGGKKVVGALNIFNPKELFQLFSFFKNGKKKLFEFIEEKKPDVCLALWALPSGWFAYQAKKKFNIGYSVWCLGSDIYVWARKPVLKQMIKKILKNADHLFADGFDLKNNVELLSSRSCDFLPSIRRLSSFDGYTIQLNKSMTNFLYIGRWEKAKGLEDLIYAFERVKKQLDKVRLYILGWGDWKIKMKELIRKLKLNEHVEIVGKVSAKDLMAYLKDCDCLVIPSRGDSIPLVLSEAVQMKTPVIGTDVGDLGFLIRKFDIGKVVLPGEVENLSSAMIEFAKEKKDYTQNMEEFLKLINIEKSAEVYLDSIGRVSAQLQTETIETVR